MHKRLHCYQTQPRGPTPSVEGKLILQFSQSSNLTTAPHGLLQPPTAFCRHPQPSADLHRPPQTSTDLHRPPQETSLRSHLHLLQSSCGRREFLEPTRVFAPQEIVQRHRSDSSGIDGWFQDPRLLQKLRRDDTATCELG